MLVLGGYGRLYGGIVGAVAYMVLAHFLSKAYPTACSLASACCWSSSRCLHARQILGMFDNLMQWWRHREKTPP